MERCKGLHESWARAGCTGDADWYVRIQGELSVVQRRLFDPPIRPPHARGEIKGFTPAARFRLLKWIATVDWKSCPDSRFISLTYPDQHAEKTYAERSKEKYLFLRYLEGWAGKQVPALWRTEWVPRQSGRFKGYLIPHFHLLCFGAGFLPNETARGWWRKILHEDGPLDTDVRKAPKDASASYYVAKYAAKLLHLDIASYHNKMSLTGRQWGVTRRKQVPMHPVEVSRLFNKEEIEVAKAIGRESFSRYGEYGEGGFTMLGADRAAMLREKFKVPLAE